MKSIAAIVAAYNEEKTIASVIETIKNSSLVDKIIVISDGSTDSTASVAEKQGAEVIDIRKNVGKGSAVMKGLEKSDDSEIVVLLDADLIGLQESHIKALLDPIISEEADMTIGMFSGGRVSTDIAQRITPFLSGQRAVKREILDEAPNKDINQYGLEAAITKYTRKNNVRTERVMLENLTHRTKEEKMGFFRGFYLRIKMYLDVLKTMVKRSG